MIRYEMGEWWKSRKSRKRRRRRRRRKRRNWNNRSVYDRGHSHPHIVVFGRLSRDTPRQSCGRRATDMQVGFEVRGSYDACSHWVRGRRRSIAF